MHSFAALDVETANSRRGSICSIGVVEFVDGEPRRDLHELIDPRCGFSSVNVKVHGIRPELVAGRPTFAEFMPALAEFVGDLAVYHYTAFDRTAIWAAAREAKLSAPAWEWRDSSLLVRRAWPERARRGYGLAEICKLIGHQFTHHDALADAKACGYVTLAAIQRLGEQPKPVRKRPSRRIQAPVAAIGAELRGQRIVFTGAMALTRREAAALAERHGGTVAGSVSSTTTLLVVADAELDTESPSSKLRKARQLHSEGRDLRIVSESAFLLSLGLA